MISVTFLRPMLSLHFSRAVGTAKTSSTMILRGLFFQKLLRANYRFTFLADASLVSKIFFCDIDAIACFIGSIPNLIAAPISIVTYIVMIGYNLEIGWDVLMILSVFLIAAVFVLVLSYLII
jgi:ABC-type bacteriocin/lantibiotic exporter with double-glycine peptidase domain